MENRSGLVLAMRLTQATGLAERTAASRLIADLPGRHRIDYSNRFSDRV